MPNKNFAGHNTSSNYSSMPSITIKIPKKIINPFLLKGFIHIFPLVTIFPIITKLIHQLKLYLTIPTLKFHLNSINLPSRHQQLLDPQVHP